MEQIKAAGVSQRQALVYAGISRSTWQYRNKPRPVVQDPVPHAQRRAATWLTDTEVDAIIDALRITFDKGHSVYQGFMEALDAGAPVASLSSWYRIAAEHLAPDRPITRRKNHKNHATPEVEATCPGQAWSWDITKFKGPYRGLTYEVYMIIDLFSRVIVGHRVEEVEDDHLAQDMFLEAMASEATIPEVVHSDGGPSMQSKVLTDELRQHGIELSKNRPRVANDNPFSEALFKFAKYRIDYPEYFANLQDARAYADQFVSWYNTEHRHSELEGHTPASVHDGSWRAIHHQRQQTMDALAAAHPKRYTTKPELKAPKAQVGINTPKHNNRLITV